MIRIIFPFAMFLHGLIHLLGFVKEWELAQVKQLTGETLHTISLLDDLSKINPLPKAPTIPLIETTQF